VEQIADVYARSLFEGARDVGRLDVVREQIGQFADAVDENRELQVFFFSPYFSTEEKTEGLKKLVDGPDPIVLNFLILLVEKHRMPAIFRIRTAFDKLWDVENHRLPVEVTSAIELTATVDPDVIGGLVVRVGNTVLDASIRHRLDQLRKEVARA
jgi:ATP synthase F1 delta subunit